MALAGAAADPTLVDTAIAEAAAAAGASSTFAAAATSEPHGEGCPRRGVGYWAWFPRTMSLTPTLIRVPDMAGLDCFNETRRHFSCYMDLYPDDDAAMLEALQDPSSWATTTAGTRPGLTTTWPVG